MPACLKSNKYIDNQRPRTTWPSGTSPTGFREQSDNCVTIGLINNMPDGALKATERQFLSLLDAASDGIQIRLSLYALPGVPRNELAADHVKKYYSSAERLWGTHLDGLIVTGREPLAANLADEPYLDSFTKTLEWALDNTYSTVWSCLAAHAALLHNDGIHRVKSQSKHCGVFECTRIADHKLTEDTPSLFNLPHSRWNGIPEDALTNCGYRVLTRSVGAGVDTFVKQYKSLFVFFQGHPEYEWDTLLLEYRRDVGRYLRGDTNTYPLIPKNYFDNETAIALAALQEEAKFLSRRRVFAEISRILPEIKVENTWRLTSTNIYRNWLRYICAQKQLGVRSDKFAAEEHRVDESTLAVVTAVDACHANAYARNRKGPKTSSEVPGSTMIAR